MFGRGRAPEWTEVPPPSSITQVPWFQNLGSGSVAASGSDPISFVPLHLGALLRCSSPSDFKFSSMFLELVQALIGASHHCTTGSLFLWLVVLRLTRTDEYVKG